MYSGTLAPVSNAETWTDTLEFINDETGDPWFVEESPPDEITIKLRDPQTKSIVLSLSLSGGEITVTGDGEAAFEASASAMAAINPKTYEVGILYENSDTVSQVLLGTISVLDGL